MAQEKCCTPEGQIKRYVDCIGCDRKPDSIVHIAQQKLYTEEQVKEMIEKSRATGLTAEFLTLTTPAIELPSDEEIEQELALPNELMNEVAYMFIEGAKWMKEQILKNK